MTQEEINRLSYNAIADSWQQHRRQKGVNLCVKEFCGLLPEGARVLDVGCGTGYPIAAHLASRGFRVCGIDISENMLEKARALNLPASAFYLSDFLSFSSPAPFDALIAFDSLWHISQTRQADIYPAAASLLSPGGYFLFTHGKRCGTVQGGMFGHEFIYSALDASQVKELLLQNGFEILRWLEDYAEESTGDRELVVAARKKAE